MATDPSGRPFVIYLHGTVNGSNDYVRIRYRTAPNTWVDDSPPGTAGGLPSPTGTLFAHTPQVYISRSGTVWVFLGHDALLSPGGYAYQAGGPNGTWRAYATIDPRNKLNTTAGYAGLDGSASVRRHDGLRPPRHALLQGGRYPLAVVAAASSSVRPPRLHAGRAPRAAR